MRRAIAIWTLVLCGLGVVASPVSADMTGTFADSFGSSNGGEFLFTPSGDYNGLTLDPFSTFCLERNEYLDFSHVFSVVDIGTSAMDGGLGGGNPDPLNEQTAWLYQSFRDGTLADYGYSYDLTPGGPRVGSANALQNVVWGIEDELGPNWAPSGGLETAFYNAAVQNADGLGKVRVLNIAWPSSTLAQSQLVLVPVPGAVVLGIVGLGMVGWARRKRKV